MDIKKNAKGIKTTECICKEKIPEDNMLEHSKICHKLNSVFNTLPEFIIKMIDQTVDSNNLKALYVVLKNAKKLCRTKMKSINNLIIESSKRYF